MERRERDCGIFWMPVRILAEYRCCFDFGVLFYFVFTCYKNYATFLSNNGIVYFGNRDCFCLGRKYCTEIRLPDDYDYCMHSFTFEYREARGM